MSRHSASMAAHVQNRVHDRVLLFDVVTKPLAEPRRVKVDNGQEVEVHAVDAPRMKRVGCRDDGEGVQAISSHNTAVAGGRDFELEMQMVSMPSVVGGGDTLTSM